MGNSLSKHYILMVLVVILNLICPNTFLLFLASFQVF